MRREVFDYQCPTSISNVNPGPYIIIGVLTMKRAIRGYINLSPKSFGKRNKFNIACTLITANIGSNDLIIFNTLPNFLMFFA